MKRFSEQLKKQANSVKLRAADRRELRERLVAYMEYHPLPAQAQPKPHARRQTTALPTEPFSVVQIPFGAIARWTGAFSVIILVLIPVWAERAVPGDTLYPIKVRFNEELRSTLTFTPAQKIEWETTRLNRRIAEARLLASEGRLTEALEVRVAEAVRTHSENVQREIDAIRAVDADEASLTALEIATTLDMHASSFAMAEDDERSSASTRPVRTLIADAIAAAQAGKTEQYSSTTIPARNKLLARIEIHTTRLYEMRTSLARTITADELTEIDRRIADINRAIEAALALEAEDPLATRFALVDIIQRSQRLLVFAANLDIRNNVTLETIAPIERTAEEYASLLAQLTGELDGAVEAIAYGVSQLTDTDDADVAEKVAYGLAQLQQAREQIASTSVAMELTEAITLSQDALVLAHDVRDLLLRANVKLSPPLESDANTIDRATTSTSTATTTDADTNTDSAAAEETNEATSTTTATGTPAIEAAAE